MSTGDWYELTPEELAAFPTLASRRNLPLWISSGRQVYGPLQVQSRRNWEQDLERPVDDLELP